MAESNETPSSVQWILLVLLCIAGIVLFLVLPPDLRSADIVYDKF